MTAPQLTRDEAQRVLEELSAAVNADKTRTVWTFTARRATVAPVCHWQAAEDPDWCVELFDEYCRERAVLGSATATHAEMDAAEASCDRLLSLLLGVPCPAVQYRYVGGDVA